MRAPRIPRIEVLRVLDDGCDDQIRVAVRFVDAAEIFGDGRVAAVGDAVALQIARAHARRDHLQLRLWHRTAFQRTSAAGVFPCRHRDALQTVIACGRARDSWTLAEGEPPRLLT